MISGPIIEPSSGLPPKQLIIFVHGYGADGNDLLGLASHFPKRITRCYLSITTCS
jgi:phospholipase/carboxylesterase